VRYQLEHGPALAAFDAGINGSQDPGIRPFATNEEAELWARFAAERPARIAAQTTR